MPELSEDSSSNGRAPLWGLVLAGGLSLRMGRDKARLDYHGSPQVRWAYGLLAQICKQVFISVAAENSSAAAYAGLPAILDLGNPGSGPAAGLLAAWTFAPQAAWLVLAADMPFVTLPLLRTLAEGRDPAAVATVFHHDDGTLEPLCTIWEPAARPRIQASVSLRRVLETSAITVLALDDPTLLRSVNTSAEDAAARAALAARGGPPKD